MRIVDLDVKPCFEVAFLNAGRGPGDFYVDRLPIHIARVDRLPDQLSAIIATADLQGRERFQDRNSGGLRLLGEILPAMLAEFLFESFGISASEVGVLLAGDFYTVPALDKRGGSGNVTAVWTAFGEQFAWVAGVAGNHDTFREQGSEPPPFESPLHFLDKQMAVIDGICIAGISGIVGDPKKPWRKTEETFEQFIEELVFNEPDILLMHDGPDVPELGLRGSPRIRQALAHLTKTLVVRGHARWDTPLAMLASGLQILNVDSRTVILVEE